MAGTGPRTWTLVALYVGMIVGWGFNFIFVKIGLADSPPLWLAALRALLGTAGVAAGLLPWKPTATLSSMERRDALLLGIPTTGLFFGLWFTAANQVLPGETAVVVYTFPLWVVVLSSLLSERRPNRLAGASVVVGFLGVVLMEQPWNGHSGVIPLAALLELLAAAVCWALGTVLLKARIRGPLLRTANVYQLSTGALVLLVGALIFEPSPLIHASLPLVVSLLWLGLVGTAIANVVWFVLLERFPAPTVSTWAFLTPVVALIASVLLFGETLNLLQYIGVAAVLASVFTVARSVAPRGNPRGG
jgi:probable blue pigment (indigoidine) exporter